MKKHQAPKVVDIHSREEVTTNDLAVYAQQDDKFTDAVVQFYNTYREHMAKMVGDFKQLCNAKNPKAIERFQQRMMGNFAAAELLMSNTPKKIEKINYAMMPPNNLPKDFAKQEEETKKE